LTLLMQFALDTDPLPTNANPLSSRKLVSGHLHQNLHE
jgi:hypothetical protein